MRRAPGCCWLHVTVVASLHWFPGHQIPSVGLRQPSSFVGRFRKARLGVCLGSVQCCLACALIQFSVAWRVPWFSSVLLGVCLDSVQCCLACALVQFSVAWRVPWFSSVLLGVCLGSVQCCLACALVQFSVAWRVPWFSSVLLGVHTDRRDCWGRGALDGHRDFHTAPDL